MVWQWSSDAYGNGAANEDVDGDQQLTQIDLRFPGQLFDAESGLYYNYYRYYDPKTGRYITSDPIGLAGGINTFAYVGGNPTNLVDPDGLRYRAVQVPGNSWSGSSAAAYANYLYNQIRRIDPTFTYNTARPNGPLGRPNQRDITQLEGHLNNAQNAGFCGQGAANAPSFPTNPGQYFHIFRNDTGHVNPNTMSSQQRFINLFKHTASNPSNLNNSRLAPGAVRAGVNGYTANYNNGQVWVFTRNGVITDAGVNAPGSY